MRARGADHRRKQSLRPAEPAAVERPLHDAPVEAEHGCRQRHGFGVLQVAGDDRLIAERVDAGKRIGKLGQLHQQQSRLVRAAGDHHAGKHLRVVETKSARDVRDAAQGHAELDRATSCPHVFRGRFGEEAPEVGARDEEVARLACAREAVAQHVNEDLRGGVLDRRVERRYAQRLPDVGAQHAALLVIVEQPGDAPVGLDAKFAGPKRSHEAQRAETLSEIRPHCAEQRKQQVERVGESRRAQVKAVGKAQLEGHAKQKLVRVGADPPHHPQRLAIGADQDVLAVVEVHAVYAHAPGAAAQAARGLENGYGDAALGERDGCGEARPAGADDSYAIQSRPLTLALSPRGEGKLLSGDPGPRHAIQSLRTGVSAVRCLSTWKRSRAISSSSAR